MSAPASTPAAVAPPARSEYRLPSEQKPVSYDLALVPSFEAFTFQGHVVLTLDLTAPVSSVVLNSAELTYPTDKEGRPIVSIRPVQQEGASVAASADAGASIPCTGVALDAKAERATFEFGRALAPGRYQLSIRFDGIHNDQLAGFYRSSYKRSDGTTSWLVCTQFEATDARRCLPCVDEPAAKARFDVTLFVSPTLAAVSNMPVLSRQTTGDSVAEGEALSRGLVYPAGLVRYTYYSSPVMSTYLLAFIIGEFDYISRTTASGTEVRVYTALGKTHLGRFSLDTAVAALEFYNEWFDTPYPLPKCDLLAVPDFAAGAMENWGAITYRETALLVDPTNSSQAVMQRVARTVCHELAHMWFGNLVTMEWWSFLWLNEGFARFCEHMAVDHIYPHMKIWENFVAEVYAQAQNLDALESSHPVEVTVYHSAEVNEIFDSISYAKGASVIRMLQAALGPQAFQAGLRTYLKRHAYQNTFSSDLWAALSESSGKDVAALMAQWTQRVGYPVLKVGPASDGVKQRLCLCQERFLANHDVEKVVAHAGELWPIPVQVNSWPKDQVGVPDKCHEMKVLFSDAKGDVPALGFTPDNVIKVNPGQTGFYRVQLDPAILAATAPFIPALPPVDRLGLLRDAFALGSSGRTSIAPALDLLQYYAKEENFAVVSALSGNLSALVSLHDEQPYHPKLQALVRASFRHSFERLGWAPVAGAKEDLLQMQFRALVLSMLCGAGGDAEVQAEALRRFRAYAADPSNPAVAIVPDLRGLVYSVAAKKGSAADHEALLRLYRLSDMQEEKNRLLSVLGLIEGSLLKHASDPSLAAAEVARVQWALQFLSSDEVRPGQVAFLMGSIGGSAVGRREAWAWFKGNFGLIQDKFCKGQNFIIAGILNGMLGGGKTAAEVAEIEAFFAAHPIPQAQRTLRNLAEAITTRATRLQREQADVKAWLDAHPGL